MNVRRQIEVSGIVQGVGFRPYIYRLAKERNLAGEICNTPNGVKIEVQGPQEQVEDFVTSLPREAPPLAKITGVAIAERPCNGDREFRIVASQRGDEVHTLISPDVSICDHCLREMLDPHDRRYRYPFINCTNCGPRFTIVHDIPYDRPHTSMSIFPMCPACQAEYDDPENRRFHAQPNACWDCGPRLELWNGKGHLIGDGDPIRGAIQALERGQIVAVKGLGGFHLVADAGNQEAVALLRERKHRVEKPFAVMMADLNHVRRFCELDAAAEAALQSVQRPIVLLRRKHDAPIVTQVAPGNRDLGVFLPYTPLHHLLFAENDFAALVMTSGNLSEEPIAIDNHEAVARLQGVADLFLVHNRDILLRCDDSVVRVVSGKACQMRRSRGYVPVPVFLNEELPPILAVGGELKNTVCITKGTHAFLSQHIGDLENRESYAFFEQAITHLSKVLEIQPEIVAYDLHPDYFSTRWALESGLRAVGVQHHHAHIASCMAENHVGGRVIGFALDGTGYGTDGNIWGGEVLVADYDSFDRMAHFEYVPLPGGSAAIAEPWRMAVSYLFHHFGRTFLNWQIPFVQQLDVGKTELLLQMIEKNVNSPLTSSCGRLFDAVAALSGIRHQINYEAQAAIELEMRMEGAAACEPAYPLDLIRVEGRWIISTRRLFEEIVLDLSKNKPASVISQKFHDALVAVFVRLANLIRQRTWLEQVCLSGGTFHNRHLLENLMARLRAEGFEVFVQSEVPAGDGGLSLGQALVAAHRIKKAGAILQKQSSAWKTSHA